MLRSESISPSFIDCFGGDPPDQSMLEQEGAKLMQYRFVLEDQIVQAIIEVIGL